MGRRVLSGPVRKNVVNEYSEKREEAQPVQLRSVEPRGGRGGAVRGRSRVCGRDGNGRVLVHEFDKSITAQGKAAANGSGAPCSAGVRVATHRTGPAVRRKVKWVGWPDAQSGVDARVTFVC